MDRPSVTSEDHWVETGVGIKAYRQRLRRLVILQSSLPYGYCA